MTPRRRKTDNKPTRESFRTQLSEQAAEIEKLKSSNEIYITLANTAYEIAGQRAAEIGNLRAALDRKPVAFVVEGIDDNKVIAHTLHFDIEEARNTASVFAQHYLIVNTVPLYEHGLWPADNAILKGQMP
jgi:hypothetical protein